MKYKNSRFKNNLKWGIITGTVGGLICLLFSLLVAKDLTIGIIGAIFFFCVMFFTSVVVTLEEEKVYRFVNKKKKQAEEDIKEMFK